MKSEELVEAVECRLRQVPKSEYSWFLQQMYIMDSFEHTLEKLLEVILEYAECNYYVNEYVILLQEIDEAIASVN